MTNIITFHTMSEVLRFERVLKEEGIGVELMPVPRHLSTSCGTCARVGAGDIGKIRKIIEDVNIEYDQIHQVD